MKILKIDDFYDIDKRLSDVEEIMRNSQLDNECFLVNSLRSYLRIQRP